MIVVPVSFHFLFGVAAICALLLVFLWLVGLPRSLDRAFMRRAQRRHLEATGDRRVEESRIRSGYYRHRRP